MGIYVNLPFFGGGGGGFLHFCTFAPIDNNKKTAPGCGMREIFEIWSPLYRHFTSGGYKYLEGGLGFLEIEEECNLYEHSKALF